MTEVACRLVPLDVDEAALAAAAALLSPDEGARADRFRFARDRRRFVVARAALRRLLGAALGQAPGRVVLLAGPEGKPELAGHPVHFNLSHSGDLAAIALCRDAELGVDIEQIRPLDDLDGLIATTCSPREAAALAALAPFRRREAFFRVWTRKEAYLKALGTGLAVPLDSVSVTVAPGRSPRLEEGAERPVCLMDLPGLVGYSGAVSLLGERIRLTVSDAAAWRQAAADRQSRY